MGMLPKFIHKKLDEKLLEFMDQNTGEILMFDIETEEITLGGEPITKENQSYSAILQSLKHHIDIRRKREELGDTIGM